METLGCIRARASVRSYKPDRVPESIIKTVLEAATESPSAGNVQDWEFVVVKNPDKRKALADAALGQDFLAGAPVVIVVCSDLRRISSAYGSRGVSLYSIQDTAAAVQTMMLAACELGLGTCWVGAFDEDRVRKILNLPEHVRPMAIVPVGYPARQPRKPRRMEMDKVVHKESY